MNPGELVRVFDARDYPIIGSRYTLGDDKKRLVKIESGSIGMVVVNYDRDYGEPVSDVLIGGEILEIYQTFMYPVDAHNEAG